MASYGHLARTCVMQTIFELDMRIVSHPAAPPWQGHKKGRCVQIL